jgi:hypothetical protein
LPPAGSDHFPVLAELALTPEAVGLQDSEPLRPADTKEAKDIAGPSE